MVHEARAEELRDREDPLGVADFGDDLVLEEGGEGGGTLGAAGGAEPTALAREGQEELGSADGATDAG